MRTTHNSLYTAPEVQVVELCVEQGFALSPFEEEVPGLTGDLIYDKSTNDFDL
ncbi:MAG: hypothetical protein IKB37_04490 [Rikenellaceae bacterium]|nr:hypothetical protein [Rikenellaceae bacterium]